MVGFPLAHTARYPRPVFDWPGWHEISRVLLLADYNTRIVVIGAVLLGLAAGTIGAFTLLRRRALMGDALSHATLPGIGLAFILGVLLAGSGKALPLLLAGAVVTGTIGVGCILAIRHLTRLKEDTALGIVLSVFFGAGVALLGVIQKMQTGHAAGLESFIYGKTASMVREDALLIGAAAVAVILMCAILFKEFRLVCFDQGYAASQGWPVVWIDVAMMSLVVAVTVIGLQAVGLILVIALLIIPAAAARFWTHRMSMFVVTAAVIGALSAWLGATMSALQPRAPSGALIVLCATAAFIVSMVLGPARGVLWRFLRQRSLSVRVARQHLLRAMYELHESHTQAGTEALRSPGSAPAAVASTHSAIYLDALLRARSWTPRQLDRLLRRAQRDGLVEQTSDNGFALTDRGLAEALRVTRNHRLWELYLITYADIAPSHVDRDADTVEHILGPQMAAELEYLLEEHYPALTMPASPHRL